MKIITWNIAYLPRFIRFRKKMPTITGLLWSILEKDPDIICLQEVFTKRIRRKLHEGLADKYTIYKSAQKILLNGGLMVASKYRVKDINYRLFSNNCGEDALCDKGFLHIMMENGLSVINTHLNADPKFGLFMDPKKVRRCQLRTILRYINKLEGSIILCGDLNIKRNSENMKFLLKELEKKYENVLINENIMKTYKSCQYDYIIICGKEDNVSYKIYNTSRLSDHNMLECIVD